VGVESAIGRATRYHVWLYLHVSQIGIRAGAKPGKACWLDQFGLIRGDESQLEFAKLLDLNRKQIFQGQTESPKPVPCLCIGRNFGCWTIAIFTWL
jgi:hypothetical protein